MMLFRIGFLPTFRRIGCVWMVVVFLADIQFYFQILGTLNITGTFLFEHERVREPCTGIPILRK